MEKSFNTLKEENAKLREALNDLNTIMHDSTVYPLVRLFKLQAYMKINKSWLSSPTETIIR